MPTRDELADGVRMIIREGLRVSANYGPDDWSHKVHTEENGWMVKQVFAHLTSTAEVLPVFVGLLKRSGEGGSGGGQGGGGGGIDIDAFNAQQVAAKDGLSEAELLQAFQAAHEKAIEFIQQMPDEDLNHPARFLASKGVVSDVLGTNFVLHGLYHIYATTMR
jgi:hypothetical protein